MQDRALLVLRGSTLGFSLVALGSMNIGAAPLIGAAKALIVVFAFIKLARSPSLVGYSSAQSCC